MDTLPGIILIKTVLGRTYPVACHGRDPEEVAALASADIGEPCKVVREGDKDD